MGVRVVGAARVDAELAVAPAAVRDVAVRVAGARAQRNVLDIEMLAGAIKILELHQDALQERIALEVPRVQVVGRLVCRIFVGFNTVAEPDGVRAVLSRTAVGRHVFVEVVAVLPSREVLLANVHRNVARDALRDDDESAEAVFLRRDSNLG